MEVVAAEGLLKYLPLPRALTVTVNFVPRFFLRSFQRKTKKNTISFVVSTISTSESEDIERTYMVTPTFTAGPASSSYKDFSWEGICFDRGGKGSLA